MHRCGGIETQLSACQDTCVHRSGTTLGSSTTYPAASNYDGGYMATSQSTNPLAYNWNTIYVKYCEYDIHSYTKTISNTNNIYSGASFSGNNDTTEKVNATLTLHWKGFRILNGVFKELAANYNWNKATDVLIRYNIFLIYPKNKQ